MRFDGCYSSATRDSFNNDKHVLVLVGLTEKLVRGVYARAFCFARDKTKYFCLVAASRIASRENSNKINKNPAKDFCSGDLNVRPSVRPSVLVVDGSLDLAARATCFFI